MEKMLTLVAVTDFLGSFWVLRLEQYRLYKGEDFKRWVHVAPLFRPSLRIFFVNQI